MAKTERASGSYVAVSFASQAVFCMTGTNGSPPFVRE